MDLGIDLALIYRNNGQDLALATEPTCNIPNISPLQHLAPLDFHKVIIVSLSISYKLCHYKQCDTEKVIF